MIQNGQIQELLKELTSEARIAAFVAAFEATSLRRPRCANDPPPFAVLRHAHHLINRTGLDVLLLEIGDRTPNDQATHPDDDIRAEQVEGSWRFSHRDGTPW